MSRVAQRFPRAVHVTPLHALASIAEAGELKSKTQITNLLGKRADMRQTTAEVDTALGLSDFVHLYLLPAGRSWTGLPILNAQLQRAAQPPFPHVAVVFDTAELLSHDLLLCLWNAAISRPKIDGKVKGGNWARGTKAASIAAHWAAFKETSPDLKKARGEWRPGIALPVLDVATAESRSFLLATAAGGMPELLVRSRVRLEVAKCIVAFSDEDSTVVRQLKSPLPRIEVKTFPGYESDHAEAVATRSLIAAYFNGGPYPRVNFDVVRSRPKHEGDGSA